MFFVITVITSYSIHYTKLYDIIAGIKVVQDAKVGDTITHLRNPTEKALPGFKEVKPMVFSGLGTLSFPVTTNSPAADSAFVQGVLLLV